MTIIDLNQRGRRGKYRWYYSEIDALLPGETLVTPFESIREMRLHEQAARRMYRGEVNDGELEFSTRKYSATGKHVPAIYVRRSDE